MKPSQFSQHCWGHRVGVLEFLQLTHRQLKLLLLTDTDHKVDPVLKISLLSCTDCFVFFSNILTPPLIAPGRATAQKGAEKGQLTLNPLFSSLTASAWQTVAGQWQLSCHHARHSFHAQQGLVGVMQFSWLTHHLHGNK